MSTADDNNTLKVESFEKAILNNVELSSKKDYTISANDIKRSDKSTKGRYDDNLTLIPVSEWSKLLTQLNIEINRIKNELGYITKCQAAINNDACYNSVVDKYEHALRQCNYVKDGVEELIKNNRPIRQKSTSEYIKYQYVCTNVESTLPLYEFESYREMDKIRDKLKSADRSKLSSFTRKLLELLK